MNALLILINEIITLYLYTLFVYVVMGLLIQFQMINNYNKIINTILEHLFQFMNHYWVKSENIFHYYQA